MRKLFVWFVGCCVFSIAVAAQSGGADLILYNGKIFGEKTNFEALAIRGEKILAVGTNKKIKKLANRKTRLIDLQGKTVVPGFNDGHSHFEPLPSNIAQLTFKSMEPSWAETVEAIEAAVKIVPKGELIFGVVGGRVIADAQANRFTLDKIAPDHPVYLVTFYGHGQIVNSKAMVRLKISESPVDPLGGFYERDAVSKKFDGRIFEYAEWRQNRTFADETSDAEVIEQLKKMANEAVGFGITSMQIMPTMRVERFVHLLEKADLPIRVRAMPFSLTTPQARDLTEIQMLSKLKSANPKITASGIKWVLDGTPFERGAAMRNPYADAPDTRGKLNFSESEITKMITESLALKQPLLFHTVGDRTAEVIISALEKMRNINWKTKRVRIEHGDGLNGDLIERAKKLGIIVVENPSHFTFVEMIYARYTPQNKFQNARSLIDAGISFALGSDGPMNPFLNIMFAAIHPSRPTEAITREQAVRAYTSGSAFAEFAEQEKGSLKKGNLADLAVLSQDIFTAPLESLPATHSLLTIVGGKIVYDAKVLK